MKCMLTFLFTLLIGCRFLSFSTEIIKDKMGDTTVKPSFSSDWLTKNNKNAMEAPFEVYLNDPATVKDPALLRTDVYQKIK